MIWPDNRHYFGEYFEDKKHGFGVFEWGDGRKYAGDWKNGKQDGIGQFTNKDGVTKKTRWFEGKKLENIENDEDSNVNNGVEK